MIEMCFICFLILLIIGIVVTFIMFYLFKVRPVVGIRGFLTGIFVAWLGGWLGSPVFGNWWLHYGIVYYVPAILGAFVLYLFWACYKETKGGK
ncbi:MAG: GlsB/YeaQ/YmgE family stress response membrane protein [Acidobacteriota bacterium]